MNTNAQENDRGALDKSHMTITREDIRNQDLASIKAVRESCAQLGLRLARLAREADQAWMKQYSLATGPDVAQEGLRQAKSSFVRNWGYRQWLSRFSGFLSRCRQS